MKVKASMSDLSFDGGWSVKGDWMREVILDLPDDLSDRQIARRIKKALKIPGMRKATWSKTPWCWRVDTIGAWADVIDD
jgi:hypothetical protein